MNVSNYLLLAGLLGAVGVLTVLAAVRVRRTDPVAILAAEFEGDARAAMDDYRRRLDTNVVARLFGPLAERCTAAAQRLLPANALDEARRQLVSAGLSHVTAEEFLAVRVLALLGGLGVATASALVVGGGQGLATAALVLGIGLMAPRAFVDRARDDRQEAIRRELPDSLDLLAISVEAGLGFEQAVSVVADRASTVLAGEFGHMLREIQLGRTRVEALRELQRRVDVADVDQLVLALVQADALGMPLTRVLRSQAAELRRRRRQRVREDAAKLPVKILFPMVFFIFPALFVVVLGPAVLGLARTL